MRADDLRRGVRFACAVVGAVAISLASLAAAPAQDSPGEQKLPRLELTDAQKQAIAISVTNQNLKNEAPPNFQPIVGAAVPAAIELENMPKTIVELAPETRPFRLARVVNQVVIVDPQTRRVVEVIDSKAP